MRHTEANSPIRYQLANDVEPADEDRSGASPMMPAALAHPHPCMAHTLWTFREARSEQYFSCRAFQDADT
jgi:hypothetical protein